MNLDEVIQSLEKLNSQYGVNFTLITKNIQFDSKYKIANSYGFDKEKLNQLKSIIENDGEKYRDNIFKIKPVLKECYLLEISKRSTTQLFDQYYDLMSSLSQAVCKAIAKEWIKVAEPKKQALYPYKFFNNSKPPWWPPGVNHIEPDHLDKDSRISVLINILRNPLFDIQALKLRTGVLEFKYPITFRILDEIYYLAVYDRLFFGQGRENNLQADILSKLTSLEREKLSSDKIGIVVSDIRSASAGIRHRGLIMVRQIRESWLNNDTYILNTSPNVERSIEVADQPSKSIPGKKDPGTLVIENTPDVQRKKRKSYQVSKEDEYTTQDSYEFTQQTSESSVDDSPEIIHVKQEPDYLESYKDFDYEAVSQDIVNHLDSAMEDYTSSPSSEDFYS